MNKPEYLFTGEVRKQVESFKEYLYKRGYDNNTILQKSNYTGYFLKWLESEQLQAADTRYNDLLNFIDYCKLEGKSKNHVKSMIASVRDYYKFLKVMDPQIINPAINLYLKGERHKVVSGIIDFKELENLYQTFETTTNRHKRNKIILGLLIYQGVTTEDLIKLEPGHLKLKEGKIYIPGNRKRHSRTLELKSSQILELHEYLSEIRPQLLQQETSQLFISMEGKPELKNSLHHLFRTINKTNPEIHNPGQIRQSTITYWLKTQNLRQVQYMAGHKYVSSTERYKTSNLENLQSKLEKLHPLNDKVMFNL
jgi:integrase/recombinase XerD